MLLGKQDGRIPLLLFRISSTLAVTQRELVTTGVRECIRNWRGILARKATSTKVLGGDKDFLGEVMSCLLEILSILPGEFLYIESIQYCFKTWFFYYASLYVPA